MVRYPVYPQSGKNQDANILKLEEQCPERQPGQMGRPQIYPKRSYPGFGIG